VDLLPKTASVPKLKAEFVKERRANRNRRALIESVREEVRQNRRDINVQVVRLGQLQADLDAVKRATKAKR
jgi:hypothetical protein